ncbi:thioredoxin family protein [Ramlibacter sp. PS4R-6]|uniref:thioredoxin family protein n=1 Tax=Ramlibacter sp. PS4R-6 TaxID=3133438 RepID=UPI0030B4F0B2
MRPVTTVRLMALSLATAAMFGLCAFAATPDARAGIAWQLASTDADVDRAFALARQQGKPLFFYWGAVWCPPCNQVKATLFSRADFIERSRTLVPVYVDGDKPGAQKVAARFNVTGYPTMVLFRPDGTEVTRLPGEVDPERYLLTLTAGLEADASVKQLVAQALARRPLTEQQWRLLAFYSWETDQQQVFKSTELGARLSELSALAPAGTLRDRLALKAAAARAQQETPASADAVRAADRALVDRLLADAPSVIEQRDLLVLFADSLVKYLAPSPDGRAQLATAWDAALAKMLAVTALSRIDALDALDARVDLWKSMDRSEQLAPARRDVVRSEALRLVAQSTDRYERQAVVPSAAHVLASAGLLAESDALLRAELPRAVSPYYHMLGLASNAKKRGDKAEALRWYELAWRKSEGPATRLQWGAGYLRELTALAPAEVARISSASASVIGELEPKAETFFERNQRSLQKMAGYLLKWEGADTSRAKVVARVKQQLLAKCARLPKGDTGRANCESVFAAALKNES